MRKIFRFRLHHSLKLNFQSQTILKADNNLVFVPLHKSCGSLSHKTVSVFFARYLIKRIQTRNALACAINNAGPWCLSVHAPSFFPGKSSQPVTFAQVWCEISNKFCKAKTLMFYKNAKRNETYSPNHYFVPSDSVSIAGSPARVWDRKVPWDRTWLQFVREVPWEGLVTGITSWWSSHV